MWLEERGLGFRSSNRLDPSLRSAIFDTRVDDLFQFNVPLLFILYQIAFLCRQERLSSIIEHSLEVTYWSASSLTVQKSYWEKINEMLNVIID